MNKERILFVVLLGGFLSACQTAHWERPNTGDQAAQADLADCRQQASREAYYQSWRMSPYFYYGPYPYGPYGSYWRWRYEQRIQEDRYYRERQLANFCMRSKGYQLVPDAPEKP